MARPGRTVSLLPDCLAARLPGTLAEVEATACMAQRTPTLKKAADLVRPHGVGESAAVRWTLRRVQLVELCLALLRSLYPAQFAHVAPTLVAFGAALGTQAVLVRLRAVAAAQLGTLPAPLGFRASREKAVAPQNLRCNTRPDWTPRPHRRRWGKAALRRPPSRGESMNAHDADHARAVALFRYGVIAELLRLPPGSPERAEALRANARQDYAIPGSRRTRIAAQTLRDWLRLYDQGGFDGLHPKPCADRGSARRLPPPTEMRMLLVAAESISARDCAFVLLMRYSGLSIQDAATLARDRLDGTLLTLRRGKSGELVQVDLPAPVVTALASLPVDGPHFFWTGNSAPVTAAKLWRHRLRSVATAAKVANFHSHRLRDTFAVELLLAGVSMGDVSILLGHSSVQTTERYYAPWNRTRRDRLVRVVREAHGKDSLLDMLRPS